MTLLQLHFQRRTAKLEASGMLETSLAESRELTLSEQLRFDALTVRLAATDAAISQRESLRKLVS
jgi:hypothetical protein